MNLLEEVFLEIFILQEQALKFVDVSFLMEIYLWNLKSIKLVKSISFKFYLVYPFAYVFGF